MGSAKNVPVGLREKRQAAGRAGGYAKAEKFASASFAVDGWDDLKKKTECELLDERVAIAKIDKETAAAKRDQERGKLLTREQVRARDERAADIFRRGLLSFIDLLAAWVPADKILPAQAAFREHSDITLNKIADEIAP